MENCAAMPDGELLRSLKELVKNERRNLARILSRIAEVDRRRLAQKEGYHSLFDYCLRELRYSEPETAIRIHAARAAAKFPLIYSFLATGRLSLTAISKLAPHLTTENHRSLLSQALKSPTRKLDALLADLHPEPAPPERIRHITIAPEPAPAQSSEEVFFGTTEETTAIELPPSPRRVQFSFTADENFLAEVDRAKELLRHKHPFGRLEEIFSEALRALMARINPGQRLAGAKKPVICGADTRKIPNWIKKIVWDRDQGRCVFVGPRGIRCASGDGLEFDHVRPFALGGRSDETENVRLLCRAHNDSEARRVFGDDWMEKSIKRN